MESQVGQLAWWHRLPLRGLDETGRACDGLLAWHGCSAEASWLSAICLFDWLDVGIDLALGHGLRQWVGSMAETLSRIRTTCGIEEACVAQWLARADVWRRDDLHGPLDGVGAIAGTLRVLGRTDFGR